MEKRELMHISGDNVRRYRMERGITQETLAELVDCNTSTITRIEGGTRLMSLPMLLSISKALHVSADTLLQRERDNCHFANIITMIANQTPASLAHLENVLRCCIMEYGESMNPDDAQAKE